MSYAYWEIERPRWFATVTVDAHEWGLPLSVTHIRGGGLSLTLLCLTVYFERKSIG